ncbi:YqzL family protein [Salibacterium aidingense]|nr:YqzL family protein [Salibacterium aidingense]
MLREEHFPWDLFYLTGNIDAYLLTKEVEQNQRSDGENLEGSEEYLE